MGKISAINLKVKGPSEIISFVLYVPVFIKQISHPGKEVLTKSAIRFDIFVSLVLKNSHLPSISQVLKPQSSPNLALKSLVNEST